MRNVYIAAVLKGGDDPDTVTVTRNAAVLTRSERFSTAPEEDLGWGTSDVSAPEQAWDISRTPVSDAADVFSVGFVACELPIGKCKESLGLTSTLAQAAKL